MYLNIKDYENLSLEILSELEKGDEIQVALLLERRQVILDTVIRENQLMRFRMLYQEQNLTDIDNKIKLLLENQLNETREKIKEHSKKQKANNAYINSNKGNVNIFSTQG